MRAAYIVFPLGKKFATETDAVNFARKLAKQPGTASIEIYRNDWIWSAGVVRNNRIRWTLWRGNAK